MGRYGSKEFCIVLPGTSAPGAAVLAERALYRTKEARRNRMVLHTVDAPVLLQAQAMCV